MTSPSADFHLATGVGLAAAVGKSRALRSSFCHLSASCSPKPSSVAAPSAPATGPGHHGSQQAHWPGFLWNVSACWTPCVPCALVCLSGRRGALSRVLCSSVGKVFGDPLRVRSSLFQGAGTVIEGRAGQTLRSIEEGTAEQYHFHHCSWYFPYFVMVLKTCLKNSWHPHFRDEETDSVRVVSLPLLAQPSKFQDWNLNLNLTPCPCSLPSCLTK